MSILPKASALLIGNRIRQIQRAGHSSITQKKVYTKFINALFSVKQKRQRQVAGKVHANSPIYKFLQKFPPSPPLFCIKEYTRE